MKKLNDRLAVAVTNAVGTMWCAYVFTALALISLPNAITAGTAAIISWIAQTFLQLVLLSILMVGQKVLSDQHGSLHDKVDAVHEHLGIGDK